MLKFNGKLPWTLDWGILIVLFKFPEELLVNALFTLGNDATEFKPWMVGLQLGEGACNIGKFVDGNNVSKLAKFVCLVVDGIVPFIAKLKFVGNVVLFALVNWFNADSCKNTFDALWFVGFGGDSEVVKWFVLFKFGGDNIAGDGLWALPKGAKPGEAPAKASNVFPYIAGGAKYGPGGKLLNWFSDEYAPLDANGLGNEIVDW